MFRDKVKKRVENIYKDMIDFRRDLHQFPEASGNEVETTKKIGQMLAKHNIPFTYIKDFIGISALIKGAMPGPTVAYRADIDALPMEERTGLDFQSKNSCSHTCGHDIHTSVLLGTTLVLNSLKDDLAGNVRVVFQGSEETGQGAIEAIKSGVLNDPRVDYVTCFHTWPDLAVGSVGLRKGAVMASSAGIKLIIRGQGGHAAHPHKSIDPVVIASYIITALQTVISRSVPPLEPAVFTLGYLKVGDTPNIIAETAIAEGSVRTFSTELEDVIEKRMREVVEYQAKSFGATAELEFKRSLRAVINDETVIDLAEKCGNQVLGKENVIFLEEPSMGGEDFSFYLNQVPGALIRLGTQNDDSRSKLPLHNPEIIFDERSIKTGILFMSNFIPYLLNKAIGDNQVF